MLLVNSLTFYEKMISRITVEIIGSLIYKEKLKRLVRALVMIHCSRSYIFKNCAEQSQVYKLKFR